MRKWRIVIVWVGLAVAAGWLGFGFNGWQFLVGNGIAAGLTLVDRLVYAWWLYPFEQSSIQIQYWTRKKDLKAVLGLLLGGKLNQQKLLLRSMGFAVAWLLLAIYVTSSTGSIVAMGIIMGLGFDLGWNILKDWKNPNKLSLWYCWQIKRVVTGKEARWYGGIFLGGWLIFMASLMF